MEYAFLKPQYVFTCITLLTLVVVLYSNSWCPMVLTITLVTLSLTPYISICDQFRPSTSEGFPTMCLTWTEVYNSSNNLIKATRIFFTDTRMKSFEDYIEYNCTLTPFATNSTLK